MTTVKSQVSAGLAKLRSMGARPVLDLRNQESAGSIDAIRLSPTGAWLSLGVVEIDDGASGQGVQVVGIEPQVYDATTGEQITLDIPGDPPLAAPIVWLDNTTLQVLVADDPQGPLGGEAKLYTCTVPDGSCRLASAIDAIEPRTTVVMPDGRWYGFGSDRYGSN